MDNRSETEIRVRYSETDAMRFVYYANYFVWFEVARTSALEELGHPYHEMEKRGCLIPVLDARCSFMRPARYGDRITIRVERWKVGAARVRFDYQVLRGNELLATGNTIHAFMHPEGRAIRPPAEIISLFPNLPAPQAPESD